METMQTIYSRKSVRTYTGEKISENDLRTIIKAANSAPVGMGKYENVHLTIIENPEILRAIEESTAKTFGQPDMHPLYGASVFILVSSKPMLEKISNVDYSNAAIIVHNMALAAVELGLGNCGIWSAAMGLNADQDLLKKINLPQGFLPCCGIIIGGTTEQYSVRDIPENRIAVNYLK